MDRSTWAGEQPSYPVPRMTPPRAVGSRFVVIEGNNGAGKSTTAHYLRDRLDASLFHYFPQFNQFRREVGLDVCVEALPRLIYYLGATMHLSDLVRSQLARGHVICDRYLASPLSLLIGDSVLDEGEARQICHPFEHYLCVPDLVLLLTVEHAEAAARIRRRTSPSGCVTPVERLTLESKEFFVKREAALRRQTSRLGSVVEINTTGLSADEMCSVAWARVAQTLGIASDES